PITFQVGGPVAYVLVMPAPVIFIAPYFALSAFGGEMADRYDKALVAQRIKFAEIGVSLIAVIGFWLHTLHYDQTAVTLLYLALFGFGVCGSLFGPIKYGILPDHLARSELPAGNALVEGATFVAILLGTIVGGLAAHNGGDPASFGFLMIIFSVMCWGPSKFTPPTGEAAPDLVIRRNVIASTGSLINHLRDDRRIWWGAFVTSWFWLAGSVVTVAMQSLVKDHLGGTEEVITTSKPIFGIPVPVRCGLAAWLAAGRIILLPTLLGAVLLGLFTIDMGVAAWGAQPIPGLDGYWSIFTSGRGIRFVIDLAGLAISGGLFIVPVFSAVQ